MGHPIMFDAESMRANSLGDKCQTRRLMNPEPVKSQIFSDSWRIGHLDFTTDQLRKAGRQFCRHRIHELIWIKESYQIGPDGNVFYKGVNDTGVWRTPIFMPRELSRATVLITNIRCERLQEMCGADAEAEGVLSHVDRFSRDHEFGDKRGELAIDFYRKRWDGIHKKTRRRWDANPWVFVICYEFLPVHIGELIANDQGQTASFLQA